MKINIKTFTLVAAIILFSGKTSKAGDDVSLSGQENIISTAVPFLTIGPDSRSGGLGSAGVAISPDINSLHWNPSKFAFIDKNFGVGISYTPWLRELVSDINLYYLTGFYRLDKLQVISGSLRYFSLGEITFQESEDDYGYNVNPNEFALDIAYSRMLSDHFSGSVAFRFIYSDIFQGYTEDLNAGTSFAADLSFFYKTKTDLLNDNSDLTAGINISNIGNKISYDGTTKQFIPTNLRLGAAYSTEIDEYNSFTFTIDANKLLVPTPPLDTDENETYEEKYRDTSVPKAMLISFSDAPGGLEEELHEITYAVGVEYWYAKQFAARAGYFHEDETKGNRKYFTAGIGLQFNTLTIDASYIIPVVQTSPLANTIRFSLAVDLDQFKAK
jgi:hypothetical protein